jgi:hypothetical protein
MKKTAVQKVFNELEKLHPNLFDIYTEKGRQFVHHFHKFLEIEKEQIGYSKEDVLKAAEIGEVSLIDAKHIVSLLDEAKQLNNEK